MNNEKKEIVLNEMEEKLLSKSKPKNHEKDKEDLILMKEAWDALNSHCDKIENSVKNKK